MYYVVIHVFVAFSKRYLPIGKITPKLFYIMCIEKAILIFE